MSDGDFKAYSLPDPDNHPAAIILKLIELEEHTHIKDDEIVIECLMLNNRKMKQGKQIIATMQLPSVQGQLKDLFDMLLSDFFGHTPDFLLVIDAVWWNEASEFQQEALIWHELCRVKQELDQYGGLKFTIDGAAKYGLRGYDVSAFNSEVSRYGAWSPDLQQFVDSFKS